MLVFMKPVFIVYACNYYHRHTFLNVEFTNAAVNKFLGKLSNARIG